MHVWHISARSLLDIRKAAGNRTNVVAVSIVNDMNGIILVTEQHPVNEFSHSIALGHCLGCLNTDTQVSIFFQSSYRALNRQIKLRTCDLLGYSITRCSDVRPGKLKWKNCKHKRYPEYSELRLSSGN